MKSYALIFAGGTGQRMCSKSLPKQFLSVQGKPIIIHTLQHFENCKRVDGICVVCYEPYINELKRLVGEYNLTKIIDIVPGGDCGQQSIFNGLKRLSVCAEDNDIVLIHDGVRPLIDENLIERNIDCAEKNGNAVTVAKAIETVVLSDSDKIVDIQDRAHCFYAKAPQSFKFGDIFGCHNRAIGENLFGFIDSASMMRHYGFALHVVECSQNNIKITTQADYFMFKGLLDALEFAQMNVEL